MGLIGESAKMFQCNVFQHNVFQNTCGGTSSANPAAGGYGFRDAWRIRVPESPMSYSSAYIRISKKIAMYREQLDWANRTEADRIEKKIKELEQQLLGMV